MQASWIIVLMFVLTCHLSAQAVGRITGTVINEDGQVVDHADVCTSVTSGNQSTIYCCYPADKAGQFRIDNVKFGSYELFAIDEDQGYSIANQSPGIKVNVGATNPSPDITIRLRPRGGILAGSVKDKVSGKPIDRAVIQYVQIDDGAGAGSQFIHEGKFILATPINTGLLVFLSAKGYRGWVYTDASSERPLIKLGPGEQRILDIELEPLPNNSAEK